jgi:A/G-specific adenine glycosylase
MPPYRPVAAGVAWSHDNVQGGVDVEVHVEVNGGVNVNVNVNVSVIVSVDVDVEVVFDRQSRHVIADLVTWYRAHRRDLPWRRTRDPYAIWVSEVMLQQTRVDTVVPYWRRWMTAFPTVRALASAPLDDVLAAWAGLGYYSRARNLHAGAKRLAGTAFPSTASELREVPGIGPYTAGAIASIAFGEKAPLVDGNVARVLARAFAIDEDVKSSSGSRTLWKRAGELVAQADAPGDLNQALMELGATVCTPTKPRCLVCPIARSCAAYASGRQDELPVIVRKSGELPLLDRKALWLEAGGDIVLARRVPKGLFGGLWELPPLDAASALGVTAIDGPVAVHEQTLTHRRLRVAVYRAPMPARLVDGFDPGYDAIVRIAIVDVERLGVASATSTLIARYRDDPWSSTPKRLPSSPRATRRSSKASASSGSTSRTRTSRTRPRAPRRASTS